MSPVRLACLNHAASVHSEPGSNSPKRVQNLVILELLLKNFLIGGPNQSHKVNFKELPFGERVPARTSRFVSSRDFPEIPENLARKSSEPFAGFIASLLSSKRPACHEGRAEHALVPKRYKSFL
jgi:hypothetical protein